MRFLPTRVHAVIDYVAAVLLVFLPYTVDAWQGGGPALVVPIALGTATIVYSLLTDYELGLLRVLPMRVHLLLDLANGAVLALSPWLFGFAHRAAWPYVAFGLFEIGASLVTRTDSGRLPGVLAARDARTRPRL